MNTKLAAYYALPADERETVERQLYHIVFVVYAADTAAIERFARQAAFLGIRHKNPLMFAIAELTLDLIAQES